MQGSSKESGEAISKRHRLAERSAMPEVKDLLVLLAEAEKLRGRMIEVPWRAADDREVFVLTVEFEQRATLPIWSLYQGDAGDSRLVWSCRETDMYLLYDLLCMFMAQLKPMPSQPAARAVEAEPEALSEPGYFDQITPVDFELLKEQPNVMLGHLLVEAGIIPEPLLDSALKLQEMVRNEQLTPEQAIDAMRRAHGRTEGQASARPQAESKGQAKPQASARPAPQATAAAHHAAPSGEPVKSGYSEAFQVCEFLKQAGILSADDVEAASKLKKRPGGELELLLSAGKIDKLTHEAGITCWRMIQDNLLRAEQGIIALHYCQRMRVSLQEALTELGWVYPY
jgi:hypothetical protein